ncbi:MAG TPA: DUF502 domain-containing protein [Tianweitania sediminis]|nr:DUF502 domain-containing protein [Tianweitania sediminis]
MADPIKPRGMARLRNYFLTGVVVIAPLGITAYLTWYFISKIDSWVKPYIPHRYNPESYLPFAVPGFGLLVALVFITLVGFLTANFVGRSILNFGERILDRIPLARNIYRGLKQIFATILANRADLFSQVGLVEWPRPGCWSIVFIARQHDSEINVALAEREGRILSVFRPITPNITTGYLLYVNEKDVIPLTMTIEEAARLLVSAGLVVPEFQGTREEVAEKLTPPRAASTGA